MSKEAVDSPESVVDITMPLDVRIRLIELTGNLGEQEADRAWQRYGIVLTLNAGLLFIASYTLSTSLYLLTTFIGLFGLFLSIFSYRIVSFSQFFEERWRLDMKALIDEDPILTRALRSRSSLGPRLKRPYRGSSTGDSKTILVGVAVFWICLSLVTFVKTLFPTINLLP